MYPPTACIEWFHFSNQFQLKIDNEKDCTMELPTVVYIYIRFLFSFLTNCYGLNVCIQPSPNLHVEILMPDTMVLGDWAFGRWLGPEEPHEWD